MRGDCLGTAGHPDVKTPYVDTLAANGVRFEHAYSACPSCIAARAALYTGLTQRSHGRVGYMDKVKWNYPVTIAGEFAKAGYYTQCVGKMHVHPSRNLLGFHNVELHDGYLGAYRTPETPSCENQAVADDYFYWLKDQLGISADVTDTGVDCNSWVARPWIYDEKYHPTNWVTSRSLDFLRRRDRSKPFFLMASFVRPHPPFDAPACYFDMYKDMDLRPPVLGDWEDEELLNREGRIFNSSSGPIDPELIRQAQIGYYACITHVDHQIGRLMEGLMEQGVYDNTIIAFVSDHGELLSDHHLYRKIRPYQGSIHVPLIISGPERLIGRQNRTISHIAELRDVMPTLLDLAGCPIPGEVEGISLKKTMDDESVGTHDYIHGEHSGGEAGNQYIVTERDKYIWYTQSGTEQYFDLKNDPNELHNLIHAPEHQDRIQELRQHLIAELDGREEGYSDGRKLIPGRPDLACLSFLRNQQ